MDEAWQGVFDKLAKQNQFHKITFYTKAGYKDLTKITNQYLQSFKDVKTAIDIGCGPGFYVDLLEKNNIDAIGIDYSKKVIKKAQKLYPNHTFQVGNAYDLKFSDNSFDLVLNIGLLQCVFNHEKAIEEMCRISKNKILVSTLYHETPRSDVMQALHKKLQYNSWPTRSYHPNELKPLFEKQGFSVKIKTHKDEGPRIQDGFFLLATKN